MDLQRKVVIKEGVVPPRKTRQGLRGRKHNFLDDVNYGQYAACGKLSKKDYTRLSAAVRYFNHTNEDNKTLGVRTTEVGIVVFRKS